MRQVAGEQCVSGWKRPPEWREGELGFCLGELVKIIILL